MKKIWTAGLLVTLVTAAADLSAQSAEEILEKVREQYETVQDAELRFAQTVRFPLSKMEQHLSGTLLMKKGNKYRIETEDMTIVTDGKTVWSHSKVNNQVLIDNFRLDERAYSPERILLAAPTDFTPTLLGNERLAKKEVSVLKLVPTDQHGFIRTLKLWVGETDYLIKKVELVDANDKETTYSVNDLRLNRGVSDARFTYPIPEGVEIVDLR
jgi:outer membrane lipoprotein carrier protein